MNESIENAGRTRRSFLLSSATVVAGGSLLANTSLGADPAPAAERAVARPKRNWKKGFYGGWGSKNATILENFKILKDAGFDGLEINAPSGKEEEYKANIFLATTPAATKATVNLPLKCPPPL